ncbi:hypothetical protein FKW77_002616 [Venturia effusa]|uniref:Uncharacterized protein n=1 Tax=Venturia effusa TaxID=50376 RepID=A0A517KZ77_9PEZI|nr:hypothetical protein FKW77_002616 [Venturia effusa]
MPEEQSTIQQLQLSSSDAASSELQDTELQSKLPATPLFSRLSSILRLFSIAACGTTQNTQLQSKKSVASLMTIPRELRNKIYVYTINDRDRPELHYLVSVPPPAQPGVPVSIPRTARPSPTNADGEPRSACISNIALVCKQFYAEYMQESKIFSLYVFHIIFHRDQWLYDSETSSSLVDVPFNAPRIAISLEWVKDSSTWNGSDTFTYRSETDIIRRCRREPKLASAWEDCMPKDCKLNTAIWSPVMQWTQQFQQATELFFRWELDSLYALDYIMHINQSVHTAETIQTARRRFEAMLSRMKQVRVLEFTQGIVHSSEEWVESDADVVYYIRLLRFRDTWTDQEEADDRAEIMHLFLERQARRLLERKEVSE